MFVPLLTLTLRAAVSPLPLSAPASPATAACHNPTTSRSTAFIPATSMSFHGRGSAVEAETSKLRRPKTLPNLPAAARSQPPLPHTESTLPNLPPESYNFSIRVPSLGVAKELDGSDFGGGEGEEAEESGLEARLGFRGGEGEEQW